MAESKAARLPPAGAVPVGLLDHLQHESDDIQRQIYLLNERKREILAQKGQVVMGVMVERLTEALDIAVEEEHLRALTIGQFRNFSSNEFGFACYTDDSLRGHPFRLVHDEDDAINIWKRVQTILDTCVELQDELTETGHTDSFLLLLISAQKYYRNLVEESIVRRGRQVAELFCEKLKVMCSEVEDEALPVPDGSLTVGDVLAVIKGDFRGEWANVIGHLLNTRLRKVVRLIEMFIEDEGESRPADQPASTRQLMELQDSLDVLPWR